MDVRDRGVVGIAEPGLVAALGPRDQRPDRTDAGQTHRPSVVLQLGAVGQGMRSNLRDGMPGPAREEDRGVARPRSVEDGEVLQDGDVVLGEQVAPVLGLRLRGRGDREPAARRVEVRGDVEPPVAADERVDPRVQADRDRTQRRGGQDLVSVGPGPGPRPEIGDPGVVARRGAGGRGDHEPAPVARDPDAVVAAYVHAGAEDLDVGIRVRAEPVQPDPAVVLALVHRQGFGRQPPDVVEGIAARQPGHRGVPGPVDRAVDVRTRRDVEHPQDALLVAALGQLVGDEVALRGGLPGVERDQAGGIDRHRVDQDPFDRAAAVRSRLGDDEDAVFLVAFPPHEEAPFTPPDRDADHAGAQQLTHPGAHALAAGPARRAVREELRLGGGPRHGPVVVGVLQPAVGIRDGVSVQHVHDR